LYSERGGKEEVGTWRRGHRRYSSRGGSERGDEQVFQTGGGELPRKERSLLSEGKGGRHKRGSKGKEEWTDLLKI